MPSAQKIQVAVTGAGNSFYIESSLPTGVTIAEYRRLRPQGPSVWKRLIRGR
jgi:hypothetical protein